MKPEDRVVVFKSIEKLTFDPANPRLPSTIDRSDESAVLDWMLLNEKVVELMIAIGEQGYFPGEVVLIVKSKHANGLFDVVEGNRRLAAVKLLSAPSKASFKIKSVETASEEARYHPQQLPTLEFDSRTEIVAYLGYRHITGVEPWDSLAKARYLSELYGFATAETVRSKYQELANMIGSSAGYVKRLLVGVTLYDHIRQHDFYGISGLTEEKIDFSLLTTAINYRNISQYADIDSSDYPKVSVNDKNLEKLIRVIFEKNAEGRTRLGESRNLKYLAAVAGSPRAMSAFIDGGEPLEQAAMLTEVPDKIFQRAILEAKKRLQLATQYFFQVNEPHEEHVRQLREAARLARDLASTVQSRLDDEE
ncbi:MAG: hypothetical protein AAF614_22055 [Chloroflexota bacterium]